jgi:hypothetical protein
LDLAFIEIVSTTKQIQEAAMSTYSRPTTCIDLSDPGLWHRTRRGRQSIVCCSIYRAW